MQRIKTGHGRGSIAGIVMFEREQIVCPSRHDKKGVVVSGGKWGSGPAGFGGRLPQSLRRATQYSPPTGQDDAEWGVKSLARNKDVNLLVPSPHRSNFLTFDAQQDAI
jgi:hypothetical protein